MTDCPGTWQEVPNLETDQTLLRCDGCGELITIYKGKKIVLKKGEMK